jgi:hydroxymethylglutaryl-CoA lyase
MSQKGTTPRVLLQEVGPRDGLQNEPVTLLPETRARLVERLAQAGLPRIQIGSFVNPRLVPQMAGTDTLWKSLSKQQGVRYSVLVLNERGLEEAVSAGIPHVEIYVSASQTHSRKNANTSVEEALAHADRVIRTALDNGMGVTAGVMCAFGCFYEGVVSVERVSEIVQALDSRRPAEIGLADTTGMANPDSIKTVVSEVEDRLGMDRIALHLHDTRGFGLANLKTALEMGVRRFDVSVGGLGGCPFIPGAKGNISTTRAVETAESLGFETGVRLEPVRKIATDLANLLGQSLE